MRHSCVGTIAQVVAPCCWVSCRWVSSCHLPGGGYTMVTPSSVDATSWQLSPAMWNIGAAEMMTGRSTGGAAGTPASMLLIIATAPFNIDAIRKWMLLRCDSITPFGRPVVPLVKRMTKGSSSSMATEGKSAPGACRSSSAKSRSNSTTGRPAGSSMPSSRSRRRRSPRRTFGSVSSTAYAISSPVHQPLSPTVIAPSAVVAQNVSVYSMVFGATIATRSPGPTP